MEQKSSQFGLTCKFGCLKIVSQKLKYSFFTFICVLLLFGEAQGNLKNETLKDIGHEVNLEEINLNHVALIADGNRRWAKSNGLLPQVGHTEAFSIVAPQLIEDLFELKINTVTLWCCSLDNLTREKSEVENFFSCLDIMLDKLRQMAVKREIRIVHLGRKDVLPQSLQESLIKLENATRAYQSHVLNLAIAYCGIDEICRAVNKIVESNETRKEINSKMLMNALDTGDQPFPKPDLIIRTSGAQRMSGFMPCQATHSELWFTETFFPALCRGDLIEAIGDFSQRDRPFGK
ncbi:MAG: di-trans,poly-cis-decaprenylcistransferase [Nitrosopumilus sp.]|nr:di-trans,poly-cis-decaprenylcistransferase [Nitrosopumilus sp.]